MAKGIIDELLDMICDEKWVGRRGEKLTERELKLVRLFGRDGKILRNIYVPTDDGRTSEVDVVYVTQKGIFVFESKNYSGWIFGDESAYYWTVMLPNKQKNKFYNPIKQNETHIKWLGQYLGQDIPLFSIIVFSERCELKKVSVTSPDVCVIKRDHTYAAVRAIWERSPDVLDDARVQEICDKLQILTDVDAAVKQAHIDQINRKSEKNGPDKERKEDFYTEKKEDTSPEKERICPRCGSPLVLRTAKRGSNAGNQFYGCSRYPNCRFIQNLDA